MLGINVMSANSERVKRWRDKNRALHNLRRRNYRKKGSGLVITEAEVGTTVLRTEMASKESGIVAERFESVGGSTPLPAPPHASKEATLENLRGLIKAEEEKPVVEDSRTVKDVVGGIYRNDHGGVISKFAWEKLQRLKEHAKENNFVIDEYSQ